MATGTATATYFGIGRDSSGTGELLFFGTVTPPIVIAPGITPQLAAGSSVTQTAADGMADTAATNLLKVIFQNLAWANIGDATGLVGSGAAGSFYLSLHSASPTESGSQSTSEISYT